MTKRVRTTRRLELWLKDTSVALFVLNLQRRLVFFNVGCEKLTGWAATDLLGQVCHFVTESDLQQPEATLASLAAPGEVWDGHVMTVPTLMARRDQDPISGVVHFYPLTDPENKVQAVLGIVREATAVTESVVATKSQQRHLELAALRHKIRQRFSADTLIGASSVMRRAFSQMKLAQHSSLPVLLIGEKGTGRRHLARQIHYASDRRETAFVPLDCRRLPADHLVSVFRRLTIEQGDETLQPGTVYLDHVDSFPRELQESVVELIESGRVGCPRFMAASTVPLEPLVESDQLSEAFFFAMTPTTILVPPLRNRMEDLEPLAQFFLEELNRDDPRQVMGFDEEVWSQFRHYHWPGNVHELHRVVSQARQQCAGAIIQSRELPLGFRAGVDRQSLGPVIRRRSVPLDPLLLQIEREQIELALAEARQNKAKAAELLNITRPRLYRRMEVLGIVDEEANSSSAQPD